MGEFVSEDQRMITCMVCGKEFLQIITHRLEELGIRVLRFWEHEINSNPDDVVEKIIGVLNTSTS